MPWVSMSRLGKERDFAAKGRAGPDISISEDGEETLYYGSSSRPSPPQPFKFGYKRQPIDWRILHGVDIERLVRETDIETLERCVGAVAFGDLDSEDARNLTEVNFMRIFRITQLTAEYLLHVQDRLAYDNCLLKDDRASKEKLMEELRLRFKEAKEALGSSRQDVKRLKKTIKTLEAAAQQDQVQPTPAPFPAPAIPSADGNMAWKLDRLERQHKELQTERSSLLQDLANLRSKLTKKNTVERDELDAEVARVRADERRAAQQRVRAAQSELQQLRKKLDDMTCRNLEMQSIRDTEAAEMDESFQTMTAKQRHTEETIRKLQANLAEKDSLLEAVEAEAAEEAELAQAKIKRLEEQLRTANRDLDESSAAVQDATALQDDITGLKEKVKQLREEHQRIKEENMGLKRENNELDEKFHDLEETMKKQGERAQELARLRKERREREEAERREREEAERLEEERLRAEEEAAAAEEKRRQDAACEERRRNEEQRERDEKRRQEEREREEAARRRTVSPPSSRSRTPSPPRSRVPPADPSTLPAPSADRPWAREGAPAVPSPSELTKWQQGHPFEMRPWDRPGLVSRTSVSRARFLKQRPEIQALLEEELSEELQGFGIDPEAERMTDEQYKDAMTELRSRQAAVAAESSPEVAARIQNIRRALAWHLHKTADDVDREYTILPNGQVAAQAKPLTKPSPPPPQPDSKPRARSASPKRSRGFLNKLCCRFTSPSKRERLERSRLDQAAAIAAFRSTYGHENNRRDLEGKDLKDASNRFYQPLKEGTRSLSQQQMTPLPDRMPTMRSRPAPVPRERRQPYSPPRAPAVEMTTAKKVRPSRPHATIRKPGVESITRTETYSEFEEDVPSGESKSPTKQRVTRRKMTEVKETIQSPEARRGKLDATAQRAAQFRRQDSQSDMSEESL